MRAERLFALKLIPLFAISGYILYRKHAAIGITWVAFGACLILAGLAWPAFVSPLKKGFDWLGLTLRTLLVRGLLEAIYFLIVTPLAWLARRVGKQFLDLSFDPNAKSYFIRREKKSEPTNYEKGF